MQFLEKKRGKRYIYTTEEVFGDLELNSPKKLEAGQLDDITLAIMGVKSGAQVIKGEIKEIGLRYKFTKKAQWDEEETVKIKVKGISLKERIKNFIINLIEKI